MNNQSEFWPVGLARSLSLPTDGLFANLQRSARARPLHPALVFYGNETSYGELLRQALQLGAYLQHHCGAKRGDRILLDMQNSPQFVISYYAILAIGAVAVPINPMNLAGELAHIQSDSGARIALIGMELVDRFRAQQLALEYIIVARYADYVAEGVPLRLPDVVLESRGTFKESAPFIAWTAALEMSTPVQLPTVGNSDLCLMPYTSGTTGKPKACMHTHGSVQFTAVAQAAWYGFDSQSVVTAFMPLFHVAAMQASMNAGIFAGATLVLMARWDRELIPPLFEKYGVSFWNAAPTMIVDVLASPSFSDRTFAKLTTLTGGGSAMPAAVARTLQERFNLTYVEGYGMTETIAPTHINPPKRAKPQCLGIPIFETHSRVVDPQTMGEMPDNAVGEILVSGPQVMLGYWNHPEADAECFVMLDGMRFLRTGDLGYRDEEGYYFAVDRLKRMINVSGYKVWPAECEAKLYEHPSIQESCVVSAPDDYKGEAVKAFVVLKADSPHDLKESDIIDWARDVMAAYKVPASVVFVSSLPRSGSNKIDWRVLQDAVWHGTQPGSPVIHPTNKA
jgi:fatty-acyl-CoA synthase